MEARNYHVEMETERSGQILNISKTEIMGFAEGSVMGNGNKSRAKENSKVCGLNIWKDTVPIYETGRLW